MTLPLPGSDVGGPYSKQLKEVTEAEFREILQERLDMIQLNFEQIAKQYPTSISESHMPQVPQVRVWQDDPPQAIPTGAWTPVTFDTFEDYDLTPAGVDEHHSISSTPSRLFCRVPGLYAITAHVMFSGASAGFRRVSAIVRDNTAWLAEGGLTLADGAFHATSSVRAPIATQIRLTAGQYIELQVFQDSGGNLDLTTSGFPNLAMHWISP